MDKRLHHSLFNAALGFALLAPCTTQAQVRQQPGPERSLLHIPRAEAKASPADLHRMEAELRARMPQLFRARILPPQGAQLKEIDRPRNLAGQQGQPHAAAGWLRAQTVPMGRELWANVLQSAAWEAENPAYGIYTFGTATTMEPQAKYTSPYIFGNAGGTLTSERLDVVVYNAAYGSMVHYTFDPASGSFEGGSYLNDYSLWSTETAVAKDGTVYGDFYSADARQFELGVVDYASDKRTTIGQLYHYYVALGVTADNVLYGVATDGNLYRIDATTALETLIGSTGIQVTMNDGTWNVQSGEIDQATGIFYWAATDATGHSALYTVDLQTGAASKVGDMAGGEQMALLYIPVDPVSAEAPAMASDLNISFSGASLSGTMSFTAPTTAYMGGALQGTLNYAAEVDGQSVETGSVSPGQRVDVPVTTTRGNHQFAVTLSNAAGNSPRAYMTRFTGDDTPRAPRSVKAKLDAMTGLVALSWDAVTEGENGGYVANITYDITRLPDYKSIATGTAATLLSDQLPDGALTGYTYAVTAVSGQQRSQAAVSNGVTYGDVPEPPYSEGFDTEASLSTFTIIDVNGDGATWKYCANDAEGQGAVQIEYANDDHDDWLITPPLKLKAGTLYNFSYRVATKGASYPEVMEVKYGSAATPEDMTGTLVEQETYANQGYTTVKKEFTPAEDGVYYFGFHALSDANYCWLLSLDDISVTGNSQKSPDTPTAVSATADPEGRLIATVSFTTPSTAIDGSTLQGTLSATIRRDGEVVGTMDNLQPGKPYSYSDDEAKNGFNAYTISTSNADGDGRESEAVKVYVGMDVPAEVKGIKASQTDHSITLSWDPVTTGDNGGYVDPEDMEYNVYFIEETSTGLNLPLVAQTTETHATIDYATNEGNQEMINYALSATNSLDEGPRVMSPGIIVGKPYDLPFEEHFRGGALDNSMWWISRSGVSEFRLMQGLSSDGDGGCAGYISSSGQDEGTLGSGKIALQGATNPTLVFSYMPTVENCGGHTTVYIHRPDDTSEQLCQLNYAAEKGQWQTQSVQIPAEYAALPYIRLTFITSATAGATIYFDDIYVRNAAAQDLRATISAPAKARRGENIGTTIEISNMGSEPVEEYGVVLYANNEPYETFVSFDPLAPYAKRTFHWNYPTHVMSGSSVTLRAQAAFDGDENPADNDDEITVQLSPSTRTAPESVTAEYTGEGTLIEWKPVTETSETVTDDFESYAPWAMDDFGQWTSVYGEKGMAKGPFSRSYPHPNEGERFAYTVVSPQTWITDQILSDYPSLNPHSGGQYLAAFYGVENSQFVPADNWLISPSLPGEAQAISFWANNFTSEAVNYPEDFQVLYSTTGTATDDFTLLQTLKAEGGAWKEYSVQLPEGATYFAIRNTTEDTYMFMLDDITYRAGCGHVTGYNIYLDGQHLATVPATASSYTHINAPVGGTNTYGVSALYAGGESEATLVTIGSGIDDATVGLPEAFDAHTTDGRLVGRQLRSLQQLPKGVYIVGGRKLIVK